MVNKKPVSVTTTIYVGPLPIEVTRSMFPDENGIHWYSATLKVAGTQLAPEEVVDDVGIEEWAEMMAPMLVDGLAAEVEKARAMWLTP